MVIHATTIVATAVIAAAVPAAFHHPDEALEPFPRLDGRDRLIAVFASNVLARPGTLGQWP
jgi:hypothetical protein